MQVGGSLAWSLWQLFSLWDEAGADAYYKACQDLWRSRLECPQQGVNVSNRGHELWLGRLGPSYRALENLQPDQI